MFFSKNLKIKKIMTDTIDEKYILQLISSNMKRIRSLQNVSQLSLANTTGLTHNFINDIENCKKGVSVKTLAKLSAALRVEPFQFFLPEDMPNSEIMVYLEDVNVSFQNLVKEMTKKYAARDKTGNK